MRFQRRAVLSGLASLGGCGMAALGGCGMAGNLRQGVTFTVVNRELQMRGVITSPTPAAFQEVLAQNPQIDTVLLQTLEGSLDDEAMINMAYDLRRRGLNTRLQSDSGIYSGAVDFFLAGVERSMVRGAEIGVHAWADSFRQATDYPRGAPEHALNVRYIKDMLGDDAFYWFTLQAAPADEIYIMNEDEIEAYGLLTRPIISV